MIKKKRNCKQLKALLHLATQQHLTTTAYPIYTCVSMLGTLGCKNIKMILLAAALNVCPMHKPYKPVSHQMQQKK